MRLTFVATVLASSTIANGG